MTLLSKSESHFVVRLIVYHLLHLLYTHTRAQRLMTLTNGSFLFIRRGTACAQTLLCFCVPSGRTHETHRRSLGFIVFAMPESVGSSIFQTCFLFASVSAASRVSLPSVFMCHFLVFASLLSLLALFAHWGPLHVTEPFAPSMYVWRTPWRLFAFLFYFVLFVTFTFSITSLGTQSRLMAVFPPVFARLVQTFKWNMWNYCHFTRAQSRKHSLNVKIAAENPSAPRFAGHWFDVLRTVNEGKLRFSAHSISNPCRSKSCVFDE